MGKQETGGPSELLPNAGPVRLRVGYSSCLLVGKHLGKLLRCSLVQAAMGPDLVVVPPPEFDLLLGVRKLPEPPLIQALVAEPLRKLSM